MSDNTPYSYLEAEAIDRDYDEQVPLAVIAENVNAAFHGGRQVRSVNSVRYAISRINDESDWYSKLEEKWLMSVGSKEAQR